jgi:enterochelin esterase-like enzyme
MKKYLLFSFILVTQILHAGNFNTFIKNINKLPEKERQARIDNFMHDHPVLPYIENDTTVILIYLGHVEKISIAGDFTNWHPSMRMSGIAGTNFNYKLIHFQQDARVEYKFVVDGNWIVDPNNPAFFVEGVGTNSELKMPKYMAPPEINYYPEIPHGKIIDTSFFSRKLNNSREIKIYLPPAYYSSHKYPLMVFHDGLEYISLGNTNNILDYMIAHHEIEPIIAVFIPPVDRQKEYAGSQRDAYTSFITEELLPVIERKYSISLYPWKRATLGASEGGNIALFIGMKNPGIFGKIGAQSSDVQKDISDTFRNSFKMNLEFYFDLGTYDLNELVPLVTNFISLLKDKNYPYQYKQWNEGHSWGSWRTHLKYALRQFFPIERQ